MTLPTLLRQYGITTIKGLAQRTGWSRQQSWSLWHGHDGVGKETMKRLHEQLGIPLVLMPEDLEDLPSFAPELPGLSIWGSPRARREAAQETGLSLATSTEDCPWPIAQGLAEDCWPEEMP
jgi:hypothetical protein